MKYVVYGLGISGLSTAKFLTENGEDVVATDDNEKILSDLRLTACDLRLAKPDEIKYDSDTIISFAPGIPLYFPKQHKILEIVKKTGATLACDIEIFYRRNYRDTNFIAITGTNGKSTTTALSGFIFKELGISAEIGGNIGVPCFDLPLTPALSHKGRGSEADILSHDGRGGECELGIAPSPLVGEGWGEGYKNLVNLAKNLRFNQTDAEKKLWYVLKNRQVENHKFRRQEQIKKYIVDFVCFEKKIIIELDGGQHGLEKEITKDQERTRFLEGEGFRVLRFWNEEIFHNFDGVCDTIWNELSNGPLTPALSHKGRGSEADIISHKGREDKDDIPSDNGGGNNVMNYIFETSSYQLDLLSQTHFHIAALLNITPDHLDRHGSMAGYIEAKKRIFCNQTEKDFALIDVNNENSKKVFDELKADKNFRATLVPISTKKIQENGVTLFAGKLVNKIGGENSELELKSEFLRGEHNDQNMAFAFAIAWLSQIADQNKIVEAIKKFRGLRHRMQIVGKIDEIKFINDSKATNAESTENALKAYENIFWILGGKAKDGGISALQPFFKKIHKAFLIGEATEEFAKILEKNSVNFEKCGDLKTAFEKAFSDAKKSSLTEKNVLLSPACASFDQWKSFEQRGDYFCKLFDELPKS